MIITDISLASIQVNDPREVNSQYIFDIDVSGAPLTFSLCNTVSINKIQNDNLYLSVHNKSDVLHLHNIYQHIFNIMFHRQNEWFENSFEEKDLNDMFTPYLQPNYSNNCIDLICSSYNEHNVDATENQIIPCIYMKSVVFDGSTFHINTNLKDFQEIKSNPSFPPPLETLEKSTENKENHDIENVGIHNESNSNEDQGEILPKNLAEEDPSIDMDNESIESIEIDEENIEKLNMKINDDDFYLLYKLVQSKIHENMSMSLREIMDNKNIKNIDDVDIDELLYEIHDISDDETTDSGLNEDDETFENNLSQIMS